MSDSNPYREVAEELVKMRYPSWDEEAAIQYGESVLREKFPPPVEWEKLSHLRRRAKELEGTDPKKGVHVPYPGIVPATVERSKAYSAWDIFADGMYYGGRWVLSRVQSVLGPPEPVGMVPDPPPGEPEAWGGRRSLRWCIQIALSRVRDRLTPYEECCIIEEVMQQFGDHPAPPPEPDPPPGEPEAKREWKPIKVHTFCPQCGPNTRVDEDGCCTYCGATAVGEGVIALGAMLGHDFPAPPPEPSGMVPDPPPPPVTKSGRYVKGGGRACARDLPEPEPGGEGEGEQVDDRATELLGFLAGLSSYFPKGSQADEIRLRGMDFVRFAGTHPRSALLRLVRAGDKLHDVIDFIHTNCGASMDPALTEAMEWWRAQYDALPSSTRKEGRDD